MHADEKLIEVIRKHKEEINDNDFVSVILEAYLQCGEKGTEKLHKICAELGLGKQYNSAVEKIIKTLLKNSDLLEG